MRLFTPDEANAVVPLVRPLLVQLRDAFHAFTFAREQWRELDSFGEGASEEALAFRAEAEARGAQVEALLERIRAHGCEVKDPTMGLIDFHARRGDGSVVLLCYRDDEEAIGTWHPLTTGFRGRRPLSEF